jgi:hypothetical protein
MDDTDRDELVHVHTGAADREEHSYPCPPAETLPWMWVPDDNVPIHTMTDYDPGAHAATKAVWPGIEFRHGMCSYHAWNIWHQKHRNQKVDGRPLFNDYQKNIGKMNKDFELYRSSPCAKMVPFLAQKMCKKFGEEYGEPVAAEKWYSFWNSTVHTCSDMNSCGLLRGGLPATNNSSETRNSGDKRIQFFEVKYASEFIPKLANMLSTRSRLDLIFCNALNRNVHSANFYAAAYNTIDRSSTSANEATFLTVSYSIRSARLELPEGTLLVASTRLLNGKALEYLAQSEFRNDSFWCAQKVRHVIGEHNLHLQYKELLLNHERVCNDWTFDAIVEALGHFHLMRPIMVQTSKDRIAIQNFLHVLDRCGLKPIPVEHLITKGYQGLLSCHCPVYLKHTWCKHAFCYAMCRGIITAYPRNMHPKSSVNIRHGRQKKACRGGHFDRV